MTEFLHDRLADMTLYDLSHPMKKGLPRSLGHPEFRMNLERRHGDVERADGTSGSNEVIVTGGHVGTHLDSLAHISYQGKLFGGADAYEAQRGGVFRSHGIDEFAPRLSRGVLLDVARHLGVEHLSGGHGIDAAELEATAAAQGVEVRSGDAVFIRTGWTHNFHDADLYRGLATGCPGVDVDGAEWLVQRGVALAGADTINFEMIPPGKGSAILPVHKVMLVDHGIYIAEVCNLEPVSEAEVYEFTAVVAPVNVVGATGAPMRLLAVA